VIAINLVDFNFPKKGGFHTCFHLREDTDPSIILTEAMEIHFINMVKWRKIKNKDIKSDSLHRWLTWLNDSSPPELIEEVIKMDMSIFTANERQELLDATDEEISTRIFYKEMIMYDEGSRLKGIQLKAERRGEKRGEKKGQETAKINIARNLLAEGSSPEFVRKITGLDMETIESL
jgi:predicted transposase/invertase (TIGR01784 family)